MIVPNQVRADCFVSETARSFHSRARCIRHLLHFRQGTVSLTMNPVRHFGANLTPLSHFGLLPVAKRRGSQSLDAMARYGRASRSRSTGASHRPDVSHSTTSGETRRPPLASARPARIINPSMDMAIAVTTRGGVTCARYYLVRGRAARLLAQNGNALTTRRVCIPSRPTPLPPPPRAGNPRITDNRG